MKVLHLFSDWKWTGPADPVVSLCRELERRGFDITLACRKPPVIHPQNLEGKAQERGVKVDTRFHLNRYFALRENLLDFWALPRYLEREKIDLVHTHLSHDHVLGALALWRCRRPMALVRTNHKGIPLPAPWWNQFFLSRFTDHIITISKVSQEQDRFNFGFSAHKVSLIRGAIDASRFTPRQRDPELARSLGINGGGPVLGIVARMQRHRRFPELLEAVARAHQKLPGLKVLIVGRGTHAHEVVKRAADLGLQDTVLFPGYRDGDYLDVLACMDAKAYLVPGSDGSCRAVMEAMAMGIPVLAACRGVLPDLVEDGVSGLLVDPDTPENLAAAMVELLSGEARRRQMGAAGRKRILSLFSLERQVDEVELVYRNMLKR